MACGRLGCSAPNRATDQLKESLQIDFLQASQHRFSDKHLEVTMASTNLANYMFTVLADDVSGGQLYLASRQTADSLTGNDVLSGNDSEFPLATPYPAVSIAGELRTSGGGDSIIGTRTRTGGTAGDIHVYVTGVIRLGAGADSLIALSPEGITNFGTVYTGLGNDGVIANQGALTGSGSFYFGQGRDYVEAYVGHAKSLTSQRNVNERVMLYGGAGIDKIGLRDGQYRITATNTAGTYQLNSSESITHYSGTWVITGFEEFTPAKNASAPATSIGALAAMEYFTVFQGQILPA